METHFWFFLILTFLGNVGCTTLKKPDVRAFDRSERQHELEQVVDSQPTALGLRIEIPPEEVFAPNSASLRPQVRKNLTELADILAKYPHDHVRILDGAENPDLAEKRALALDTYFQNCGVKNSISTYAVAARERPLEIFVDFASMPLTQPAPSLAISH